MFRVPANLSHSVALCTQMSSLRGVKPGKKTAQFAHVGAALLGSFLHHQMCVQGIGFCQCPEQGDGTAAS